MCGRFVAGGFRGGGGTWRLDPLTTPELNRHRHGLTFLPRPHPSFTPLMDGRSLIFGDEATTAREIAKFSKRDAEAYPHYEAQLTRFAKVLSAPTRRHSLTAARRSRSPVTLSLCP